MNNRLNALRSKFDAAGIDALYVSNLTNVRYLTGFTGSTALLFVLRDGAKLFVDTRYHLQAERQAGNVDVVRCTARLGEEAFAAVAALKIGRLGFEAGSLTVSALDILKEKLPGVEMTPTLELVEELRLVKDADEIAAVKKACALADEMFTYIQSVMRPGVSENDIALELEFQMRKRGAEGAAFSSIVASGENGAKPHAGASDRKLQAGDLVTLDFGARLNGYNSDITRTVGIGHVDDRQREVYNTVLRAQIAAAEALRPGLSCFEADKIARDIITGAGFGDNFGHGLGHGLGLDVHDGGRLSPAAPTDVLIQAGEIWTIEPGIYIEGWGGVRIEDDVLVTNEGPEILTHSPKELLIL